MVPFLDRPDLAAQVLAERTHLVVPSLPHWIEPTVEYLRRQAVQIGACSETRSFKLLLALHEALSNSIIHGNLEVSSELKEIEKFADALAQATADPHLAHRVVDISVDYNSERCRWMLTDQGKGFNVRRVLRRCLNVDLESQLASGRGILLMHSFLDHVSYKLGGRRVILILNRDAAANGRLSPVEILPPASPVSDEPSNPVARAVGDLIEDHPPVEGPGDNRRIFSRVVYHERVEIAIGPEEAPYVGFARDLSRGGIAFFSIRPVPAEFTIILPPKGALSSMHIRARAVRCNKIMDGLFDVGARFLQLAE
jgi:anti-sigma regulatory factor (Ser/Thr protein kinase)